MMSKDMQEKSKIILSQKSNIEQIKNELRSEKSEKEGTNNKKSEAKTSC